MGKCSSCLRCRNINRYGGNNRRIVLLLAGLDNSGKTTAAKGLVGDPTDEVVPTVGFASVKLVHRGFKVIIYDVGGGPQIRGIWSRYFNDVHGVIFVVDASDSSRIGECKVELENMLCHEKFAGKPVLLLANKQDVIGAMDEIDIVESLCLEQLVNKQKCPTKVEICSTLPPDTEGGQHQKGRYIDPGLLSGYRWLLSQIINDYAKLNSRVERDVREEQDRVAVERDNWRRRRGGGQETETEAEEDEREAQQQQQHDHHNGPSLFRPIGELIKGIENEGATDRIELIGGETTVDSNQNEKTGRPPTAERGNEASEDATAPSSTVTSDIMEQLENKGKRQTRKLGVAGLRTNRVHPHPGATELPPSMAASVQPRNGATTELPPLILSSAQLRDGAAWSPPRRRGQLPPIKRPPPLAIRPITSRSLGNEGEAWGLRDDLEVVLPASGERMLPKSDNDDVVIG